VKRWNAPGFPLSNREVVLGKGETKRTAADIVRMREAKQESRGTYKRGAIFAVRPNDEKSTPALLKGGVGLEGEKA